MLSLLFMVCSYSVLFSNAYHIRFDGNDSIEYNGTYVKLTVESSEPLVGQSVKMECKHNIDYDDVRSIKFYKDGKEFYRFTPYNNFSEEVFPLQHLQIIGTQENSIRFRPLDLKAGGIYSCEITSRYLYLPAVARHNIKVLPSEPKESTLGPSKEEFGRTNETDGESENATYLLELVIEPLQPSIDKSINMECNYYGNISIYYMKFYHNGMEFYRYKQTRDDLGSTEMIFPLPYIKIIEKNRNSIKFQPLNSKANGVYTCEVTFIEPISVHKIVTLAQPTDIVKSLFGPQLQRTIRNIIDKVNFL